MDQSQRDRAEAALKRTNDLLSGKWRPPLHIKWWNLALAGVILSAGFAVIAPIVHPSYREGFYGNLVSSAWQLMAGAGVGYIAYKRFRAERLKDAMPISWAQPFTDLDRISLSLYEYAINNALDLRNALTDDVRKKLIEVAVSARQKGIFFGGFFEIEQLADIDESCDAAEKLATLDNDLSDPQFMTKATMAIFVLHASSSKVRGYKPSPDILQSLHRAYEKWSASEGQRLRSESLVKVAAQNPVSH
jgi:hypothetical protein